MRLVLDAKAYFAMPELLILLKRALTSMKRHGIEEIEAAIFLMLPNFIEVGRNLDSASCYPMPACHNSTIGIWDT
jgi:hypothetical protein